MKTPDPIDGWSFEHRLLAHEIVATDGNTRVVRQTNGSDRYSLAIFGEPSDAPPTVLDRLDSWRQLILDTGVDRIPPHTIGGWWLAYCSVNGQVSACKSERRGGYYVHVDIETGDLTHSKDYSPYPIPSKVIRALLDWRDEIVGAEK